MIAAPTKVQTSEVLPQTATSIKAAQTMPEEGDGLQGGNVEEAIGPGDEEVAHGAEEAGGQEPQELLRVGVCQNHRPKGREANGGDHRSARRRRGPAGRGPATALATRLEPAISGTAPCISQMPAFAVGQARPHDHQHAEEADGDRRPAPRVDLLAGGRARRPGVTKIGPVKPSAAMVASGSQTTASYHRA